MSIYDPIKKEVIYYEPMEERYQELWKSYRWTDIISFLKQGEEGILKAIFF
jgi:hypothetical protein